jgi:hypothetical protein
MANHEGLEGSLITALDELLQESIVRQPQEIRVAPKLPRTRIDDTSNRHQVTSFAIPIVPIRAATVGEFKETSELLFTMHPSYGASHERCI